MEERVDGEDAVAGKGRKRGGEDVGVEGRDARWLRYEGLKGLRWIGGRNCAVANVSDEDPGQEVSSLQNHIWALRLDVDGLCREVRKANSDFVWCFKAQC